jgi:hypothetical protein
MHCSAPQDRVDVLLGASRTAWMHLQDLVDALLAPAAPWLGTDRDMVKAADGLTRIMR